MVLSSMNFLSLSQKYKINDFSNPQMQAIDKILYFIQNEIKFKDVNKILHKIH